MLLSSWLSCLSSPTCLLFALRTLLVLSPVSADRSPLLQIHSNIDKSFSLSISKGFYVYDLIQFDHIISEKPVFFVVVVTII